MFNFLHKNDFPKGAINPNDLGFNWPEIKYIYIGNCGGVGEHDYKAQPVWAIAHSHTCKDDPHFGAICVKDEKHLKQDNEPHHVMWHEYGHVLADYGWDCQSQFLLTALPENGRTGHGTKWQKVMKQLGQPAYEFVNLRDDGTFHVEDQSGNPPNGKILKAPILKDFKITDWSFSSNVADNYTLDYTFKYEFRPMFNIIPKLPETIP